MAIGSININRFQGATQRYLQNTQQQNMNMFSITGNNFQASNTGRNSLNANSSFTIPETDFSSAYAVNQQPSGSDLFQRGNYLNIRQDQRFLRNPAPIESRNINEAQNFQRPLSMSFTGSTKFRPSFDNKLPAQAPLIPTREDFQNRIKHFEIKETDFNTLKNGPDFLIPRNGPLGFKVLTDGAGTITGIETDTSRFGNQFDVARNNEGLLANRYDITQGAQFTANPIAAREISGREPNNLNQILNPKGPVNPQDFVLKELANNQNFNALQLNPEIFNANLNPTQNNPFGQDASNPFAQRLAQLQPQDQGIAVFGSSSEIDANIARQIATSQAKLNLNLGEDFARNLNGLQNAALQQGLVYSPAKQAADMSGMIPMVATLPAPSKGSGDTPSLVNLASDLGTNFMSDSLEKKGSGGSYMSFRNGGGESGSQGENPQQHGQNQQGFSGDGSGQQQQRQQRRFSYNA